MGSASSGGQDSHVEHSGNQGGKRALGGGAGARQPELLRLGVAGCQESERATIEQEGLSLHIPLHFVFIYEDIF